MNWSAYSRFVGDIFGAPPAIEGLLALFLQSTPSDCASSDGTGYPNACTFATIWLASIGTMLSAYFILAANSWMQHPVRYRTNADTGRAEHTDFPAVLTNNTAVVTFAHTISPPAR